jgi:membrane-bound lytic murein transglycosylase F
MVIIPKKQLNRKRHKWITIPVVILVLLVAIGQHFLFKKKEIDIDAISRIRARGYLIALTDKNSYNYFINHGQPMGYQLELMTSFAEYLDVPLKIIVSNDVSKLLYYLELNVGDLLALNLPISREGKKQLHFSKPFGETRMVLVQRKPSSQTRKDTVKFIRSLTDFSGDTVYMRNNLVAEPMLHQFLRKTGNKIILRKVHVKNTLELIQLVSERKINYAICDENLALEVNRLYRNIDAGLVISKFYEYGWGVNLDSDSLLWMINDWLAEMKHKELKKIYLSYFNNPRIISYFQNDYCSLNGEKLSPFDEAIRTYSKRIHWDWRLLASLIYEESNFLQGQVSSHHAKGLMQLMPETADKFGMDSLSTPSKQIAAGVKYIGWLNQQLPEDISDPQERINFILASYNVGMGRVLAAREKALKYGKDKNKWNGNVDYYLTRRSKKDPNQQADTTQGLVPYDASGGFVAKILERYDHYKNIIPQ